jgi:hypothetical protein
MASTYRVDPLQPGRLVCEVCGRAVATVPVGLKSTRGVTKQQVAGRFPDLAEQLDSHDVLCRWRRDPWPCSASPEDIEAVAREQCAHTYRKRHPGRTAAAVVLHVELWWREHEEFARFWIGFIELLHSESRRLAAEDEDETGHADAA